MSWREDIYDQASFRGVPFFVESHETGGLGRRLAKHTYPGKDTAYHEDQGGQDRDYPLRAYVIGDDYLAQRNRLIEALGKKGPGILLHPWHGRILVKVQTARLSETTRQGGMASFDLVFVPDEGNRYPVSSVDTQGAVKTAAAAVDSAAKSEFEKQFSVAGAPSWTVDESKSRLQQLADQMKAATDKLTSLLYAPSDLSGGLVGQVQGFINQVGSSLADLRRVLEFGVDFPTVTLGTDIRKQEARNQHALVALSQSAGAAAGASKLAATAFVSQQEATQALEAITDVIDGVQALVDPFGDPVADDVYLALQDLRASVALDIRERGLRLPEVSSFTPVSTLPSLVLAHQIYGDATREADITARNNVRHPGFVPGGVALEVLRDV